MATRRIEAPPFARVGLLARRALLTLGALGALTLAACGSSDSVPAGKDGACAGCHLPDFQGAHGHPGSKPTTCAVCHTQQSWHPTVLEHEWTLDGAHEKAKCFACHTGDPPKYRGLPHTCVDCHRKEYEKAKGHKDKAETCDDCHLNTTWKEKKKKAKKGG
jgi:hypothetical protein